MTSKDKELVEHDGQSVSSSPVNGFEADYLRDKERGASTKHRFQLPSV